MTWRDPGNNELPTMSEAFTDGAALPLWLSRQVHELREGGLLDTTITAGQALGGDLEAVNVFSGLAASSIALLLQYFLAQTLGLTTALQLIAFIAISGVLLALVRPIAQRHLMERTPLQLDGVDSLDETHRGAGGFGSTGQ